MFSFSRILLFPLIITTILFSFFGTTFANDILDVLDSRATTEDLNVR